MTAQAQLRAAARRALTSARLGSLLSYTAEASPHVLAPASGCRAWG
ncbi:hypothetical protein IQ26_03811 [Mesorhizobium tianshanense]|uniref:Uncharacterized protein n=1 Tax=Mesorhizobium tianshanense TaxID=39844 RepID=A0A562NPK0_9HYPH|nr:hypothetical protein IQ26_03811 [Mesorhizobium tianshanense]